MCILLELHLLKRVLCVAFFNESICNEQGRLGDCWFLSAVAVLTEVSQISEVIITPEYNEEGIYTVRFCIQVIALKMLIYFNRERRWIKLFSNIVGLDHTIQTSGRHVGFTVMVKIIMKTNFFFIS